MRVLIAAVGGVVISGLLMTAHADADPKLQALIDGNVARQDADQQKLQQVQETLGEFTLLNAGFEGFSESNLDDVDQKSRTVLQESDGLTGQIEAVRDRVARLAEFPEQATEREVRETKEQIGQVNQQAQQVFEAANDAERAGATSGQQLEIGSDFVRIHLDGLKIALDGIEIRIDGSRNGNAANLTDEEAEDVRETAQRAVDNANDAIGSNKNLKRLFGTDQGQTRVERFRDLDRVANDLVEESNRLKDKLNGQANGSDVLEAFGERLNGQQDSDRANTPEDGQRLQELAEGLAGAGQRLAEIEAEKEAIRDRQAEQNEEIRDVFGQLVDVGFALGDAEQRGNLFGNLDEAIRGVRLRQVQAQIVGDERTATEERRQVEFLEQQKQKIVDLAKQEKQNGPSDVDKEALEKQLDALQKQLNDLVKADNDATNRLLELDREIAKIAVLQAELADLIRNGAPLQPAVTGTTGPTPPSELDVFLAGAVWGP